jgi:hypothetical protein
MRCGSSGSRQVSLMPLPPGWQTLEETDGVLAGLVHRHLVQKLAACLGEGAGAFVDPFGAMRLDFLGRLRRDNGIDLCLFQHNVSPTKEQDGINWVGVVDNYIRIPKRNRTGEGGKGGVYMSQMIRLLTWTASMLFAPLLV